MACGLFMFGLIVIADSDLMLVFLLGLQGAVLDFERIVGNRALVLQQIAHTGAAH